MNDLYEFLTSQEIIIVYFIAALACIICMVVYFIEKNNDKIRRRHNTKELNKLVDIIKEKYVEEEKEYYPEPVLTVMPDKREDTPLNEMLHDSIYIDQIDVEETNEAELNEPLSPIEEQKIIKESTPKKEIIDVQNVSINSYEEDQERTAIISLKELLAKSKEMYESNELTQYKDEGNEPISLQDLERRVDKKAAQYSESFEMKNYVSEKEVEEEIKKEEALYIDDLTTIKRENVNPVRAVKQSENRFKSSPIISPIYGIEKEPEKSSIALENTADYDKLDEEIRKSNEFVMTLKELQEKLD